MHIAVQDNCTITPVISKSSADFIEGLVKDAEGKGAKLMQKYRREGNLIWPLLLDHITPVRPRLAILLVLIPQAFCIRTLAPALWTMSPPIRPRPAGIAQK